MRIPSPQELGLPEKFEEWRPNQEDAITKLMTGGRRSTVISAPTGFGKTACILGTAVLAYRTLQEPTCIVTATKGLQDQYKKDGESIGIADIRGRDNYICTLKDDEDFTCSDGYNARCPYKGTPMCPASQAEMRAAISPIVLTNYDKWTAAKKYGQGFDHIKRVIFDEGHHMPEALARAMQTVLWHKEIEETLQTPFPVGSAVDDMHEWKPWAMAVRVIAEEAMIEARRKLVNSHNPKTSWIRHYTHMKNLTRRLGVIATASAKDWVVEGNENGFQFDPIRPGKYVESALLLRVPKAGILSATIRPKTMYMSGISKSNFDFHEYDSEFDPNRCPIYWVPTMRVEHGRDLSRLWTRVDQVLARRRDVKGIIHTISYGRQEELIERSRFGEWMIANKRGENLTEKVDQFREVGGGYLLVTPSVSTGYDFPDCPSPDTKILRADLKYVEAGSLKVGEKLLGFDEITPRGHKTKQWCESLVTSNTLGNRECRRIILADGTEFICSENHQWLIASSARKAFTWGLSRKLKPGVHSIVKYLDYWDTLNNWEAGYLAGMWDGEGHISQRPNKWNDPKKEQAYVSLGMAQTQNCALDLTIELLKRNGFDPRVYWSTHPYKPNQKDKASVQILGRRDMLRFLGQMRPVRILQKLDINKIGCPKSAIQVPVIANIPVGKKEVCILSTSTKTYIARGFASHNSECRFQIVLKTPFEPPSKIQKARQEDDPEYVYYRAMQYLVQAFGRDMRSKTDFSQRFIFDDHFGEWFKGRYSHLAPKSFHAVYKKADILPAPLTL